ncbi:helix-turn-helix domain-containing protein [Mesobacillus stamsii]|uniref:Transcriptional regulator with XRE-family HTH domain n=1 Tax=Mesobacillus stamsii TaxID=225347 RepID=A0ABU0FTP0_9BACI|nr:helix-turn-helix transcriptional regulator [Mesobacillus stamsii]MDQ0412677.1 transcriptional regulator with XRE-family HTH domain [Mesobacillus stamsii]
MELGRNFIKARRRRGMDQKDAALKLDVSPGYLSRVEKEKQKPSIDLILKAADLYGVKPGFFFEKKDDLDIEMLYTRKNKAFISDISSLPPDELREKYSIQFDGKELTERELKGVMAYLRSLREMED